QSGVRRRGGPVGKTGELPTFNSGEEGALGPPSRDRTPLASHLIDQLEALGGARPPPPARRPRPPPHPGPPPPPPGPRPPPGLPPNPGHERLPLGLGLRPLGIDLHGRAPLAVVAQERPGLCIQLVADPLQVVDLLRLE